MVRVTRKRLDPLPAWITGNDPHARLAAMVDDLRKEALTPEDRDRLVEMLGRAVAERCRRRLRELDADRHRIASAPWHTANAKQRARNEIAKLAERGHPSVLPLVETPNGAIYWRETPITDVNIGNRMLAVAGDPSLLGLQLTDAAEAGCFGCVPLHGPHDPVP